MTEGGNGMPDGRDRREGAGGRILSVLEAVIHLGPEVALAAIAEQVGLPKPTVHRHLRLLVERGYVRQLDEGLYGPDLRLLSLAAKIQESLDIPQRAKSTMRRLQEILPETIHLALLQGNHAVYVEKLEGQRAYRMSSTLGMPLALHASAIGKAILAYLPEEDRRRRLESAGLQRRTARTATSIEVLELEFERVRNLGYAVDDEENEEHIRCVAAAVFDYRGKVIGGVSISAPAFALTLQQAHDLGPALVEAGGRISTELGVRRDQLPDAYHLVDGEVRGDTSST